MSEHMYITPDTISSSCRLQEYMERKRLAGAAPTHIPRGHGLGKRALQHDMNIAAVHRLKAARLAVQGEAPRQEDGTIEGSLPSQEASPPSAKPNPIG